MALDRVPTLLISDRLPIPFACGVVHPTIVLPQAAREWSDRRRRAVLCHELAHIRRLDLPVNALAQLACALYWFHPLVWVATHRLRLESERACDDLVLGVGTRPSEYADHLLQIVCRAARVRAPAMVLPMAERREVEGRMLAILEPDVRRESPTRRHAVTLGAFALAFVLPLAALAPRVIPTPVSPAAGKADETGSRQLERRDVPRTSRTEAATPGSLATSTATVPADADPLVEEPAMKPASDLAPAPQGAGKAQRSREEQSSDTTKAKVVAALVAALSDSVASVREDAVYALGQLEAEAAVGPLTASLTRDASPKVRHMAAWALGQIGSPDGVAGLGLAATKDQSEDVRGMAIWALGQIEDPASVPVLVAVLADASPEMRGRAAWALGTIEPESAPAGLLAALRDAVPSVRLRAAWALGQIEDPAAVPALIAAMKDTSAEVRRAAFWAVGQIGGDAAEPALLQALQDADPEIRARAARALGGGGGGGSHPWPWPWPMPIIK
jgi:HEAT repeat protein